MSTTTTLSSTLPAARQPASGPTGEGRRGGGPSGGGTSDIVDVGGLLRAAYRDRWRILLGGVLGLLVGLGVVAVSPQPYESTAEVLATQAPSSPPSGDTEPGQRTLDTEAQLLRSDRFLRRVGERLGIEPERVPDRFRISATPNTRLLQFTYTADTARQARQGARAVAEEFVAVRTAAVAELVPAEKRLGIRTEIVRQPLLPSEPTRSNQEVPVVSGLFGGLLVGLTLGHARQRWRPRIIDAEQVTVATGLPVAATLGTAERLRGLTFEVRLFRAERVLVVGVATSELITAVGSALRAGSRHVEDSPELEASTNRPSSAYVLTAAQRADLVLIVAEAGRNTVAELADAARLLSRAGRGTAVVLVPRSTTAEDVRRAATIRAAASVAPTASGRRTTRRRRFRLRSGRNTRARRGG